MIQLFKLEGLIDSDDMLGSNYGNLRTLSDLLLAKIKIVSIEENLKINSFTHKCI